MHLLPSPYRPPVSARVNGSATGQMPSVLAATQCSACWHHSQPCCLVRKQSEARWCIGVGSVHLLPSPYRPPVSARVNRSATGQMPSAVAATQCSACRHLSQPWCLARKQSEAWRCVGVGSVYLLPQPLQIPFGPGEWIGHSSDRCPPRLPQLTAAHAGIIPSLTDRCFTAGRCCCMAGLPLPVSDP